MREIGLLTKALSVISPSYALNREISLLQLERLPEKRAYEGGSKSKRLKFWKAINSTSNNELESLDILRARSRDIARNNGYGRRAIDAIVTNCVGTGITADIVDKNEKTVADIQELWNKFADSTEIDAEGNLNFYGLQALAMRQIAEAGECFVRRYPKNYAENKIPFEIKVIEPEYLDSNLNSNDSNNYYLFQGIKFDNRGKRLGYYLKNNCNELHSISTFISSDEIIHCFRVERSNQARGIPWLSPVLIDLKDLSDFQDAELTRRKIASCFTAFIHDIDAANSNKPDHNNKDLDGETMQAGSFEYLPPGKTITLSNPPKGGGFEEFSANILRKIAVGTGLSYEVLSGDYSRVNFSSGRMSWVEFHRSLEDWRWNILIPKFCDKVFQWFLESIELQYGINTSGIKVRWTSPRREMLDPVKETRAEILKIRSGIKSLDEVHREYGYNSNEVLKKIAHTNKELDKFGLKLDCDPRVVLEKGGLKNKDGEKSK